MHSAIVAGCFLLLILVPCLVAVYSSSKEGRSGNSGEHEVAAPVSAKDRPSRVRRVADAAFGKAPAAPAGQRTSRLHRVATAMVNRDAKKHVPVVAGDPGARRESIRELRAKHAAAARSSRTQQND